MSVRTLFFFLVLAGNFATAQVDVEVPSSRISSAMNETVYAPSAIEFVGSSVNYINIDSSTWSASTPNFTPQSPLFGANYISASPRSDYIFGFGLAVFRRSGETEVGGPILKDEQSAYLARFRAGYRHHLFQNRNSQIYASASLLPSAVFVSESSLGRGEVISTLPTQIGLGGSISHFTLEGFLENFNEPGFSAGVRIEL